MAKYVLELSKAFNKYYYGSVRILEDHEQKQSSLLYIPFINCIKRRVEIIRY
ncbi:hypothetical protein [Gracilibacillus sp. JCM 18860]|uniref:hypothetical protein n=1 Tax=Gracilibacillus sp. JCM 18860 TaxID=1306159 RepID=UPI0032608DDD